MMKWAHLCIGQMQNGRNIRDYIKSSQAPNDLSVDDTHEDPVSCNDQIVAIDQIYCAENSANLPHINCIRNLIGFHWNRENFVIQVVLYN